jgi:predicted transcriptional regulator
VRTTITLPSELHARLLSLARDRHQTVSRTVEELLHRAMRGDEPYRMVRDPDTGFLGLETGRTLTEEDVRSLDDDE